MTFSNESSEKQHQPLPSWLKKRAGFHEEVHRMKKNLRGLNLHTVCEEARCPNMHECWSRGTATIMILGEVCTRHCGFCSVISGRTGRTDPEEPEKVARMVEKMGLRHAVITMVARDDLPDGGASHVAQVIQAVRGKNPATQIEVLTSDFQGETSSLDLVLEARPDIFNHNIETVARLTPQVRHKANYQRSLLVLDYVKKTKPKMKTKSGIMLGFGERPEEVMETFSDLRKVGCGLLTIGQYLRPSLKNLPVTDYLPPELFEKWGRLAREIGFENVASGPFVRSSYHAEELNNGI
ncbi:MAG: lipoyl synthase [Deltaproteobacteria bacterium]|nr:lipoyl synthase [Deltaproteobacteria bacterium]